MPPIHAIHTVAYRSRKPTWDSHLNCGAINTHLRDALNDTFGPIADLAIGEFTQTPSRPVGAEHAWVYIPRDHVDENTPIIVDGALDQFRTANHDNGYVHVSLGPHEAFPPRVTVVAENNTHNTAFTTDLFDHYREHEREGPNQYHARV